MAIRGSNPTSGSGLDVLEEFRQARFVRQGPYAPDDETWRKWAASDFLELWQLVALHSSVDPDSLGSSPERAIGVLRRSKLRDVIQKYMQRPLDDQPMTRLQRNFERALTALRVGDLNPTIPGARRDARTWVPLDEFRGWAARAELSVAGVWVPRHQRGSSQRAWLAEFPYRTSGLDLALKVAGDLADRYMGDDLTRAPSSPETVRYAVERYEVSENTAKAIARIIRPDHLPKGRRRKRRESVSPCASIR